MGGPAGADGVPPGSAAARRAEAASLDLLATGELDVQGRLVDASNATLYCTVSSDGAEAACVYKPIAGERPLWDFPDGTLAGRELAAYLVSRAGGWDVVPPTVYRDGPFGPGMCQLWIDADEAVDLVELARSGDDARLRQMSVFDALVNNADRKIGHLLPMTSGQLYGCDHGVCFSAEYKLRTVLWQWRGKKLTPAAMAALRHTHDVLTNGDLGDELCRWLTPAEVGATIRRVERLLSLKTHPYPPTDWPAVPWPPI
ncbi:MAG TPA: SCO1664 family protein [Streptosporangiaceae bacterium]|nr:SCO1664 family protein [Streptosporangiaceae bacterium]